MGNYNVAVAETKEKQLPGGSRHLSREFYAVLP